MTRTTGHITQHAGKCTICCQLIAVRECVAINRKLGTFSHLACEMRKASDAKAVQP